MCARPWISETICERVTNQLVFSDFKKYIYIYILSMQTHPAPSGEFLLQLGGFICKWKRNKH